MKKFRVHLSVFPEITSEDNEVNYLVFDKDEGSEENQPVYLSKRVLDLIETPPEIKKQKTMLTESVKKIMFDNQSCKIKLKTDSVSFPDSLNKFLNPFDIYKEFNEALTLDDRITYDHKEVIENKVFKPVGEKFVHSILTDTNTKHWILLTEVDIFLPNRKDIDSCSHDLEPVELSKFSIKISKDKNQGRGYFELTIQAGCFQILATGGLYGNQDNLLGGFLGSSIPLNSIQEYNRCYTLRQLKESKCFYRLLRDYSKPSASYFAGFRSAVFANHGFQGAHPLRYQHDEKPGDMNLSIIASKIICNYINKRVGKNDIVEYLRRFLKTKVVKELSSKHLKKIATVEDMVRLIKDNRIQLGNYASTILYKMKIMEEARDTLCRIWVRSAYE